MCILQCSLVISVVVKACTISFLLFQKDFKKPFSLFERIFLSIMTALKYVLLTTAIELNCGHFGEFHMGLCVRSNLIIQSGN